MTDDPKPAPAARTPAWAGSRWTTLAVAGVALAAAVIPNLPGVFEGRVRGYLLEHPQILQEVSVALDMKEAQARAAAIDAAVEANPRLLAVDPRDPAFGPADAKVTVIEFFDFRCPGCKQVAPDFLRVLQANPDVRFVFKDWPILDRPGEDISHYAARAALAAHRQGRYLQVYQALMAEGDLSREAVDRILADNGVTELAHQDMASPAIARHIADTEVAGRALGLIGTPTFFINGRTTTSINPTEVNQAIARARGGPAPRS